MGLQWCNYHNDTKARCKNAGLSCARIVQPVKCSSAFMFNNRDGDSSKKAVRTLQLHISELPFSFSGENPHLHSMTQCLCLPFFVLRTTQASQLLSQFSQVVEGFVGYESGYRASRYIKTTENKNSFLFLLLRKAVLPFWFICHYIWTFLYLHYVHVAFTKEKRQNPQTET